MGENGRGGKGMKRTTARRGRRDTSTENHGESRTTDTHRTLENTARCKKYAETTKQDNATRRVKGMVKDE